MKQYVLSLYKADFFGLGLVVPILVLFISLFFPVAMHNQGLIIGLILAFLIPYNILLPFVRYFLFREIGDWAIFSKAPSVEQIRNLNESLGLVRFDSTSRALVGIGKCNNSGLLDQDP